MKHLIIIALCVCSFSCLDSEAKKDEVIIDNFAKNASSVTNHIGWREYGLYGSPKEIFIYSSPAKKVNDYWEESGEETKVLRVIFNDQGMVQEIFRFWYGYGDLGQKERFNYSEGKLEEIHIFADENSQTYTGKYVIDSIDSVGKRNSMVLFDEEGKSIAQIHFKWVKGRCIEMLLMNTKDGTKAEYSYVYNDNSQLAKELIVKYKQNADPYIVRSRANYKYLEFDKNSNWVKRAYLNREKDTNGIVGTIERRVIKYYD